MAPEGFLLACFSFVSQAFLFGGNLRFHLDDQVCQLLLTFFLAVGVDIPGTATTVGESWGVPSFP